MSGVTAPAMSQLSDLIGEFKTMDIQEFRRLAKDPDEAGRNSCRSLKPFVLSPLIDIRRVLLLGDNHPCNNAIYSW